MRSSSCWQLLGVLCLLTFSGGPLLDSTLWLMALYAAVMGHALYRRRLLWRTLVAERWLLLTASWIALSTAWSWLPHLSAISSLGCAGAIFMGLWMACTFTPEQRLKQLAIAVTCVGLISLAVVLCWPQVGIHYDRHHSGLWRGMYFQKNILGRVMGLGIIAQLQLLLIDGRRRRLWFGCLALCSSLLILSGSKAAMAACSAALLVSVAGWVPRRQPAALFAGLLVAVVFTGYLGWIGLGGRFFTEALPLQPEGPGPSLRGIDLATATGRVDIWKSCLQQGMQAPIFGVGYGCFWVAGGPADLVRSELQWYVASAHNGFLELWLGVGAVGLLLGLIGLAAGLYRWQTMTTNSKLASSAGWLSSWWVYFLLLNLVESEFFWSSSLFLILHAAALFSAHLPIEPEPP